MFYDVSLRRLEGKGLSVRGTLSHKLGKYVHFATVTILRFTRSVLIKTATEICKTVTTNTMSFPKQKTRSLLETLSRKSHSIFLSRSQYKETIPKLINMLYRQDIYIYINRYSSIFGKSNRIDLFGFTILWLTSGYAKPNYRVRRNVNL